MAQRWMVGEPIEPAALELRTADGDHSVTVPPSYEAGLTDQTWTAAFPGRGIALDREGVFQTFWGWSGADAAMSVPSAWRALTLVASTIAVMPVGAWRGLQPAPQPLLLAEPTPGENRQTTIAAWVQDLLLHGNCFGVLGPRDSRGYVTFVTPVPPDQVSVARVNGRTQYLVGGPESDPDLMGVYARDEVLHCKGFQRSGALRGQGVLEHHLGAVETATAMGVWEGSTFRAGVPSGLISIEQEIPDQAKAMEKAKQLKAAWMEAYGQGKRGVAVMTAGIKYEALSWSPEAMQVEALRGISDIDMARIFGVPAYWVDAPVNTTEVTYANVQDSATNLVRFSLEFWIQLLEAELSRLVPRGTDVRLNRDSALRPALKERAEIYQLATGGQPWMLTSEVRADEGLMPMPQAEQITESLPLPGEPVSPGQYAADQQSNAQQ